jgi:glutaconate CoA-transferase subunit A
MVRPTQMTLTEAVREYALSGTDIYIGNFGAQLFAVGHELIRQGRSSLHTVMGSGGILLDQLIGAGVLRAATFAHCWSPVGPAPASCFRRLVEAGTGEVTLREVSLGMLTAALTAGAWGVPFTAVPDLAGTVYADAAGSSGTSARVDTPFGSATVVGALNPDVAFVHVDAVTPSGDGLLRAPRGEAVLGAQASRSVVLVAEALVDDEAARREPGAVAVPGLLVDAFVVTPGALHPDGAAGRYDRDISFYEGYARAARTPEGFEAWLDRWVRGVGDHASYRQLVGTA